MECIETFTTSYPVFNEASFRNFDLQLFNEEKTEEATPKRKEEARNKGQVAHSIELNSAFILLVAFFTLKVVGSFIYEELTGYMRLIFSNLSTTDFTINSIQVLFLNGSVVLLKTALPVMFAILVTALVVNFVQVGFVFSLEPLLPQLDRLNPISGFQRLFSKRSLVELFKSLFKIAVIGYFIYRFISKETVELPNLIETELIDSLQFVAALILDLAFQISAVMIILAALDYLYQGWEYRESIKMTKHEVKQEFKQSEGDPQIKAKIKERQRAMAMRRMMQEVPKADVIVTNPTHFAIALKYEKSMAAPMIVAKGQDFMAQRIKETAKEYRVAIVENKPLARALYSATEIGDSVPPELYKAVAEVLAYVYRLKKRLS